MCQEHDNELLAHILDTSALWCLVSGILLPTIILAQTNKCNLVTSSELTEDSTHAVIFMSCSKCNYGSLPIHFDKGLVLLAQNNYPGALLW